MSARKRVFSGVQPSGALHLGNYLGALLQWVGLQDSYECIFCIVDLHALTIPEEVDPKKLRDRCRQLAALYIASGIDPERSTVFVQSHVREHTELTWILNCVTPLGWLERMTQFKAKSERRATIGTGLLDYPVLMASDVLLYDTHLVPVGEDQKQHIEFCRDLAQRFNGLFGDVFVLPEVMIPKVGARIMGFDAPETKMSKSLAEQSPRHAVGLLDSPKQIKKTVMSAVTDSGSEFRFEQASAGVKNLITVLEALSGESKQSIASRFEGRGYGHLKQEVADAVVSALEPVQQRYHEVADDPATLDALLARSAERVRTIAEATMRRVRSAVGVD